LDLQETERRLTEENTLLQDRLDGMLTQIWQLGDSDALPRWRMIVPYTGDQLDLDKLYDEQDARLSLGSLQAEEITGLVRRVENGER